MALLLSAVFEFVAYLRKSAPWGQAPKPVTEYRDGDVWMGGEDETKEPPDGTKGTIGLRDRDDFRPDWLPPSLSPDRPAE